MVSTFSNAVYHIPGSKPEAQEALWISVTLMSRRAVLRLLLLLVASELNAQLTQFHTSTKYIEVEEEYY